MVSDSASSAARHRGHRQRRRNIARRRLEHGIAPEQIKIDFIHWGVPPEEAEHVVNAALQARRREELRQRVQPVWVGGSMLVIGIVLCVIGLGRSDLSGIGLHRYLVLGMLILPAAAGYAIYGMLKLLFPEGAEGGESRASATERETAETPEKLESTEMHEALHRIAA